MRAWMGSMRAELVGAGGVVERNAYLTKRYIWWDVAWFVWTIANTLTIVFIAKGIEAGLVDFYGLRDDRLVYLCWRLGEERITHWHDLDAGVDGRRPIDDLLSTGIIS